jgi:hypothetical protein
VLHSLPGPKKEGVLKMKTSSKMAFALTGLAVLCVCAVMAAPMGAGDGAGHGGMMGDGDVPTMDGERPAMDGDAPEQDGGKENHGMDEEHIQEMMEKLQADGVDTTALETALEDGDQEAVRAFMDENRPADAPEQGNGLHRGGSSDE